MTGRKIKVLRTDSRGKYTSNAFIDFYKKAGIKKENTMTYNLQQNGVAEMKNHSITSAEKNMIHNQIFSIFFRTEACSKAAYLHNRMPTPDSKGLDTKGNIQRYKG